MRYLGLDLGTKTLGVAVSDQTGLIASFYKNIFYSNVDDLILEVNQIVLEKNIDKVVLGLPKNMNNSCGERAESTMKFARQLAKVINREVIFEDERLTTKVAESVLISADITRKKRKKYIDGLSAVVILQSYLDRKV